MLNLKIQLLNYDMWERLRALAFTLIPPPDVNCIPCGNLITKRDLERQLQLANYASQLYELSDEERELLIEQWEVNLIS